MVAGLPDSLRLFADSGPQQIGHKICLPAASTCLQAMLRSLSGELARG